MMSVQVKICGLTSLQDVWIINRYKPDYIGCVLYYPKSKRNVLCAQAKEIISAVDDKITKVAVVVSPTLEQLAQIEGLGFDLVQIHGLLDEQLIQNSPLSIIRAVNVESDAFDVHFYEKLDNLIKSDKIEGVLFDAKVSGSGSTFSWQMLEKAKSIIKAGGRKMFLAGGLNPENVTKAVKTVMPDVVDVSSGVEYEAALKRRGKDEKRVQAFIKKCHK